MNAPREFDVIVVGGGTAGTIAAIQAARAGARTLVLEMTGQLGGTLTSGGVSAPAYFWSREHQIIAGIGWELVLRCQELGGAEIPDFTVPNPDRPSYHVGVNPYLWALLAEEACLQAGAELRYHTCPLAISAPDADHWLVESFGKSARESFLCRELIDCTGDANVVDMLGYERLRDDVRQPGTLEFRLANIDTAALDPDAVQAAYEGALADGRLQPSDWGYSGSFMGFLHARGFNAQHIPGADTSTAATMTATSLAGRAALLRLVRFVRSLPGCEDVTVEYLADHATARDTWRILGETVFTYEDYMSARVFPDAVAYTLYFIDVHLDQGVHHEIVPGNAVPTLPFGALIPRGSQRLLAAGRILSSDKLAHSALRVEASCMAMGQAAGAAAALGVQRGVPSRDVPLAELHDLLRAHGAIVPE